MDTFKKTVLKLLPYIITIAIIFFISKLIFSTDNFNLFLFYIPQYKKLICGFILLVVIGYLYLLYQYKSTTLTKLLRHIARHPIVMALIATKNKIESTDEKELMSENKKEKILTDEYRRLKIINLKWNNYYNIFLSIILLPIFIGQYLILKIYQIFRRNGWKYTLLILLIVSSGLILRIWNADLPPAPDEYRHLIAAKRYLQTGSYEYSDDFIVTWIMIIMKKIFHNPSIFMLRLPFALMGTISTILIYKLGQNFNRIVALISTYLFAFCPLAIGMSNVIRWYEINLLMLLVIMQLLYSHKKFPRYFRGGTLFALTTISYILFGLKNHQLIAIVLIALLLIGNKLIADLYNKKLTNQWINYLVKISTILGLIILLYLFAPLIHKILGNIMPFKENPVYQYLFIFNQPHQKILWYQQYTPWLLILLILMPVILNIKKSVNYSLVSTIIIGLYAFIYHLNAARDGQTRYAYYFLPIIILLFSLGCHYWFCFLSRKINKSLVIIILLLIFTPYNAIYNTLTAQAGKIYLNNDYAYYDMNELMNILKNNNLLNKKILTTHPWFFDYYFDRPFLKPNEKKYFTFYPRTQPFEYLDRTMFYSTNSHWPEENIKIIQKLLETKDIEYVIFQVWMASYELKYHYPAILKNFPKLKLFTTIDPDKDYGFYIFKVVK